MSPEQTIIGITEHIRDTVRPYLGQWQSRQISGTAASGDATFAIDDVAEHAIIHYIESHGLSIALYSEDKGLIEFGDTPEAVLIVDPIDGTRPAIAGFESCVVSVAWAAYKPNVTMGDVQYACIAELKGDGVFYAERGHGARWQTGDEKHALRLLPIRDILHAPVSFEAVARPIEWVSQVLGDIINEASMKGGVFLFNSTAFSLTRLLTGQLAGVLDVGNRILRDHPQARARYVELGFGTPIGLFTYDIAAAVLIAQEAGAIVTNGHGESFAPTPLLDTSEQNLHSIVAASTPELHALLLASIDARSKALVI